MKANSWRPAEAACADYLRVRTARLREVGPLGFLKIVGTCALALSALAAALLLLATRRWSDPPAIAAIADTPVHAASLPASGGRQPPDGAPLDLPSSRAPEFERAQLILRLSPRLRAKHGD